ncbi:tryptophan synthase subunit alpha [Kineosporia sp. NBRC 101677]|uniref:flavin monoamine oxidase family protein n=1 Tax=Kineosporia sp. NBRC 101677 TaxID=3032197 RepID=UPI0024A30B1C|nr:NAD(P)/FAD-dependent oxidoreductase [Kineosporia sp. NBRC 101677]GLY16349.1 tryptophan synthase subunit alpha [Kineosporia sp. NBRC 101677]
MTAGLAPLTMFGPDFPFAYDDWLRHPSGLGRLPAERHGTEVAVVGGGICGLVTAYELMRLGLKPVVYEAERLGGRMRSVRFADGLDTVADLGAMRFAPAATTLFHYVNRLGLRTEAFPNPLSPAAGTTFVDLNGRTHQVSSADDLPPVYREVGEAWQRTIADGAEPELIEAALRGRDVAALKTVWNRLVAELDDQSFYGFISRSKAFASFRHREIFGQVGFGAGGWDTDFPNSILEILRVVLTGAEHDQQRIVGGAQSLPDGLWKHASDSIFWPAGTSLATLHPHGPAPAVTSITRCGEGLRISTADGHRDYPAAVVTPQVRLLATRIDVEESLLPTEVWTAIERTHYMGASKVFVATDRPFWKDAQGPRLGMTLTDRLPRSMYLLDDGPDCPGIICLSYVWNDDSLKLGPLSLAERTDLLLRRIARIHPEVEIRARIIGEPVGITWEDEPNFLGAFRANLPGHYRYQHRLFGQFRSARNGLFLAGDDVSWFSGCSEGAVTTGLNAVWAVVRHLGGSSHRDNPGPGDVYDDIAPVTLPYS